MSFFQSLMQFDVALRTGFRYVSNKRRNPNVTSRFLHLFYFSTSLLHCSILISVNNQLIIFLRGFRKKLLISLFLGVSDPYATFFRSLPIPDPLYVPDSGTTFFRSLPVPRFSLRTGFRYISIKKRNLNMISRFLHISYISEKSISSS